MKVKVLHSDGDTLYKVTEVRLKTGAFVTPIKAIDLSKTSESLKISPKVRGLNEIHRPLKVSGLKSIMQTQEGQQLFERPLHASRNKAAARGDLNILFLDLDSTILSDNQLEFVENTVHSFSDFVAVPLVSQLGAHVKGLGSAEFREYLKFVDGFIERAEELNSKPIMGTIPALPWQITKELCEKYVDLGVRALCFDFAGKTPSATEERNIRPFLKLLRQRKLEEETLLYAINANTGKVARGQNSNVQPAKDIISYGFGFDILGQNHTPLKGPKEMFAKIKAKGPEVRIFDKETYSYHKAPLKSVSSVLPADSSIGVDKFRTFSSHLQLQAIVNMEQKALESMRLHQIIKERTVEKYLSRKKEMDAVDLKRISTARQAVLAKTLEDEW